MVASISLATNKAIKLFRNDDLTQRHQLVSPMPCSWCASPSEAGVNVSAGGSERNFHSRPTGCSSLPSTSLLSSQTASTTVKYQSLNVYVVGRVGHPKAQIVRVVHISDTRGTGDYYADGRMPNGHILIHSGDFLDGPPLRSQPPKRPCTAPSGSSADPIEEVAAWKSKLFAINEFFQRQPHPYKIFVPGCWDYFGLDRPSPAEIQQHLPSVIYLEDASCQILGLKVYGVPWTSADDLRPEDGKSHLPTHSATSVVSRMRRWLMPHGVGVGGSVATASTTLQRCQHGQRRLRCMSSCGATGPDVRQGASEGARSAVENPPPSRVRPNVNSPDTSGGLNPPSSTSSFVARCNSRLTTTITSDGFILSDIQAVAERYDQVPSDTNILVSHMPAWRPELFTHVVDRIQKLINLPSIFSRMLLTRSMPSGTTRSLFIQPRVRTTAYKNSSVSHAI